MLDEVCGWASLPTHHLFEQVFHLCGYCDVILADDNQLHCCNSSSLINTKKRTKELMSPASFPYTPAEASDGALLCCCACDGIP